MKIKFEDIIKSELFKKKIITKAVVAQSNGKILFVSKNWKIEPSDIKQCINAWQSHAQFVNFENVKYSCLRNEPEFFSATHYQTRSYLVGAASPDKDDQYFVLGYAPPKSNGGNAYVDVVRAANKMKKGGAYLESSAKLGKYSKSDLNTESTSISTLNIKPKKSNKKDKKGKKGKGKKDEALDMSTKQVISSKNDINSEFNSPNIFINKTPQISPKLKQEIDYFLQWINNPEGLTAYIQYYLDQNDPLVISKIAHQYEQFRKVFGF